MSSAASGDLFAEQFDGAGEFVEEAGLSADGKDAWVAFPGGNDALVDLSGLGGAFVANLVRFVAPGQGRHFDMDDGGVAAQLVFQGGVELFEKAFAGAGPIGETVEGAAVAEDDGVLAAFEGDGFEGVLDVENGPLRGAEALGRARPREATAEDNAGGFRGDCHVLAEVAAGHFEHRGLTAAGSAGKDDSPGLVPGLLTSAGVRAGR